VEAFPYASSYIKTVASTVARGTEKALLSTSGWLGGDIGGFYTDAFLSHSGITTIRTIAELSDTTTANTLKSYIDATDSDKLKITLTDTSVVQFNYAGSTYGFASQNKMGISYKQNAAIAAIGGVLSDFDGGVTVPDFTQLAIGSIYGGTQVLNGWVRVVQYYPEYLPNAVLKGMTE
jgi:hypothetical protein